MNANIVAINVYAVKEVIGSPMNILSLKKKLIANNDVLGGLQKMCDSIMRIAVLDTKMYKKRDLTDVDRLKITSMLGNGKPTLEIEKKLNRDHRAIKKFVFCGQTMRKTPKRCHLKRFSPGNIRKLKIDHELSKTPHATSETILIVLAC